MCQIYLPAGNPSASNTGFSHLPHFSVSMANAVGILEGLSFQSFRNWITPVWMGPPGATDFCGGNFGAGFERTENRLILEDEGGGGSRACWWRRKNISVNLRCWNGSAVSHNSNKLQLSLSENSQTLFFKKAFSIFAWNLNKAILRRIRLYEHTNVHFVFIHETVPTLSVSLAAMKEQERYTLSPSYALGRCRETFFTLWPFGNGERRPAALFPSTAGPTLEV